MTCPKCGKMVGDKFGLCRMCGENCMQCPSCRSINYDKPDSFICINCGYSRYCKYEIWVSAMMSFQHDRVDSEKAKKICEKNTEKNLEIISTLFTDNNKIKTNIINLFQKISLKDNKFTNFGSEYISMGEKS